MIEAILLGVLGAAIFVAAVAGPRIAFGWVYFPAMILIPIEIAANVPGFPDLTGRRAAVIGLVIGSLLGGRGSQLVPAWRPFDLFPLGLVLAFSISFGSHTEFLGFVHSFAVLSMDWLLPYIFVRALWRDYKELREGITPVISAILLLALLSIFETRMATRVGREFWNLLTGLSVPPHFEMWRWGFLRAFGTFTHPLTLGVFFAGAVPLMILWGQIHPRFRMFSRAAAVVCVGGCVSSLSRGPILALAIACALGLLFSKKRRIAYLGIALACVLVVPIAMEQLGEAVSYTQGEFEEYGNTDSGHYRLALLLLYLDDIGKVGWLGSRTVVGQEYEAAWSIDNGYLYIFIEGGWLCGGLFLAMAATALAQCGLALRRSSGAIRRTRASGLAILLSVLFGMADVWFSPDYSQLVFLYTGLVINQTRRSWFGARPRVAALRSTDPSKEQRPRVLSPVHS